MKFASLLVVMLVTSSFHLAYANEMGSSDNEDIQYCKETVESSGLEEEEEKRQYYQECLENLKASENDMRNIAD